MDRNWAIWQPYPLSTWVFDTSQHVKVVRGNITTYCPPIPEPFPAIMVQTVSKGKILSILWWDNLMNIHQYSRNGGTTYETWYNLVAVHVHPPIPASNPALRGLPSPNLSAPAEDKQRSPGGHQALKHKKHGKMMEMWSTKEVTKEEA